MHKSLFWLNFLKLPIFYCNLLKVWSLFKVCKSESVYSLYWTLQEPLIFVSRFDVSNGGCFPALTNILLRFGVLTLGTLIHIAGLDFSNIDALAVILNIKSTRFTAQLLRKWKSIMTDKEYNLLKDFVKGVIQPKSDDFFPNLV